MGRGLMTTTGTFQDVIDAQVRAYFTTHNEEQSSELYYQDLGLNDYEPDVPAEQLQDISGPDKGVITIEGEEYGENGKFRGFPITVTLRKYTSKLSWTEEDVHWIKKQSSSKRQTTLKDAAVGSVNALQQNINEDTAKTFYLGFGTTFLTVGNSEQLFGSHTIRNGGGSQRNDFGSGDTHRALGPTALTLAISKMNRFQGHNAIQLKRVKNLRLLVTAENVDEALKIVNSNYGPNSGNLGLSTASADALGKRGMTIKVVEVPDIPAARSTYWFLTDMDRGKERAFIAWGWKPRMTRDNTQASKGILREIASTYFGPAIKGWVWAFGSKGDGTSI